MSVKMCPIDGDDCPYTKTELYKARKEFERLKKDLPILTAYQSGCLDCDYEPMLENEQLKQEISRLKEKHENFVKNAEEATKTLVERLHRRNEKVKRLKKAIENYRKVEGIDIFDFMPLEGKL